MHKSGPYSSAAPHFFELDSQQGKGSQQTSFSAQKLTMQDTRRRSKTLGRVLHILDTAADIVTEPELRGHARASFRSQFVDLEPTPLGTGVKVMKSELPLEAPLSMGEEQKDLFVYLLNPLTTRSLATKRRRMSEEAVVCTDGEARPAVVTSFGTSAASVAPEVSSSDSYDDERFRPYQFGQWNERFQELVAFRKKTGHCLVPHNFPENQQLAQWVKRQRYQYKLKRMKCHSTLIDEREAALEKMGFVWDSHDSGWMERYESLKQFRDQYGHASVPSNYIDRTLAIWVKCQRRQYKLYKKGARSTLTLKRFALLEQLGFIWNPRNL